MAGVLLSGPAGAGKSQIARDLAKEHPGAIISDFQSLFAAVTGDVRDASTGKYPVNANRNFYAPMVEYLRATLVRKSVEDGYFVIVTNSDGDPRKRQKLLDALGEGAAERIIDPSKDVVSARLSDPATGELSSDCETAIGRWYGRLNRK